MNGISGLLSLLSIFSCVFPIQSDPSEQPLIFNPETHEIYLNWSEVPENGGPYAVACSASLDSQTQFNEENSLDHKSLFVRHYSQIISNYIRVITCAEFFEMAVVLHSESEEKFVEFGYEVYAMFAPYYFKVSDFTHFDPLMPPISFLKWIFHFLTNWGGNGNKLPYLVEHVSNDIHSAKKEQQLKFIWLSKVVMKYDLSTWNVEHVTYFITRDAEDLNAQCDNYDLGDQFYQEDKLYKYYLTNNQHSVFDGVVFPENEFMQGGLCQVQKYCVEPYTILWPYQFRSSSSSPISCSDLPKIPVWHETAVDVLNYSETFLIAMAEVTNQRLKIITGTHEILTLPAKRDNKPREMYLGKKKIPIPKIIYKVVKYKSHECDSEVMICWFDVVIVIHNQPEVKPDEILCQDKSQDWGWESIQFRSTTSRDAEEKSKFIYTCRLDSEMEKKLGYKNDTPNKGDLNLNNFPSYNENENKLEYTNWREKFEEKMRSI